MEEKHEINWLKVQFRVILLDSAEKLKWCPSVHLEKGDLLK